MTTTIALTGILTEAVLMHSVLEEQGFHPHPIQPNMQVTHSGGENDFPITVPTEEAKAAAAALIAEGFERWLYR